MNFDLSSLSVSKCTTKKCISILVLQYIDPAKNQTDHFNAILLYKEKRARYEDALKSKEGRFYYKEANKRNHFFIYDTLKNEFYTVTYSKHLNFDQAVTNASDWIYHHLD